MLLRIQTQADLTKLAKIKGIHGAILGETWFYWSLLQRKNALLASLLKIKEVAAVDSSILK